MSKSDAISAVLESALEVFSRHGFEGASLRDIATHAKVPLSTIHRYFDSKAILYSEVMKRVWGQITDEREGLLEDAVQRATPESPPLDDIMHALVHPIVVRAIGDRKGLPTVHLLGHSWLDRRHAGVDSSGHGYNEFSSRWLEALQLACPGATKTRAIWAYSFAVGAMYSWQLLDHWYDSVLYPEEEFTASQISAMLVQFCTQGIQASIYFNSGKD